MDLLIYGERWEGRTQTKNGPDYLLTDSLSCSTMSTRAARGRNPETSELWLQRSVGRPADLAVDVSLPEPVPSSTRCFTNQLHL